MSIAEPTVHVFSLDPQTAHLARRALSSFAKSMPVDSDLYVPRPSKTRLLVIDGRRYVALMNFAEKLVGLYRLNNRGSLKLLKRYPSDNLQNEIMEYEWDTESEPSVTSGSLSPELQALVDRRKATGWETTLA